MAMASSLLPARAAAYNQTQASHFLRSRASSCKLSLSATPCLRVSSFSGLRSLSLLDRNASVHGKDFLSVVAISVASPSGKGVRGVTVAMFERFTEKAI
eukprot:c21370_g4_i1 orf=1-294(-)